MSKIKLSLAIFLFIFISACSPKSAESAPACDSTAAALDTMSVASSVSSSAAKVNPADKAHKFVRTADLRFKVKNVIRSTYNIEDIAAKMGGFVTYTDLKSNINYTETTKISADSTLETTHFTVTNNMTIRIPNTKLDTTLKEIAKNIEFLNFRVIKADDVALQMLSNELAIKRSTKNEVRMTHAIDYRGKKLNETTNAEEVVLNKQEQADNARIANLTLKEQINYSTVSIEIYQRQSVKREVIVNNENIEEFQPTLSSQLGDSFKFGWEILEGLLVFIVKLWGIYLIALIGYVVYIIYKLKTKK